VDLCLNTDFFTDKARPNCTLQPLHCNEKFIHAAGNHHWSRQNIRLIRTSIVSKHNKRKNPMFKQLYYFQ
jgi:hypothetical protein